MNSDSKHTKTIVLLALLTSIIYVSQLVLSILPNVNVVTLLLIIYTLNFGIRKTFIISCSFNILMGITYGFSYWIIGYFWIYGLLIILSSLLDRIISRNLILWSFFGLLFGLLFGFLFAINDHYFIGVNFIAYYLRGIPFDIIHGFSNMITILVLFNPLNNVINKGLNTLLN